MPKPLTIHQKRSHILPVGFVLLFAIVGVVILFNSHAATPYAAIEAETGATGGATSTKDNNASGGSYLQFGTESTTPPPSSSGGCSSGGVVTPCIGNTTTGASGWGTPIFDDEFANDGNSLNSEWDPYYFGNGDTLNGSATNSSNVSVGNGVVTLTLASSSSGAAITTSSFRMGCDVAEAEVELPGSGTTVDDWPAWWLSGTSSTTNETDIVEGLGGYATSNHHVWVNGNDESQLLSGQIAGDWAGGFHIYDVDRTATENTIYWDGKEVDNYATSDNCNSVQLLLNIGAGQYGGPVVTPATVEAKYVRVWQ